jgi:uncharacterized phage protein (TIGR02218 family)
MKTSNLVLDALLATGFFVVAEVYTLVLLSGTAYRFTTSDIDLTYGATTWRADGPLFERSTVKQSVGAAVDNITVSIFTSLLDTIGGISYPQFAVQGGLDGATILIERAYAASWGQPIAGRLHVFEGRVSDAKPSRFGVVCSVKAENELLNAQMPRNIYDPGCIHTLYDTGCTVSRSALTVSGAVNGTSSGSNVVTNVRAATAYYAQGVIAFTSGPNNGERRTVKSFSGGVVVPIRAFRSVPTIGDTFIIYPGCNRLQSTCTIKFSNLPNFRGYPYIPVPETAI